MNQKIIIFDTISCEDPVNFIHGVDDTEESSDEETQSALTRNACNHEESMFMSKVHKCLGHVEELDSLGVVSVNREWLRLKEHISKNRSCLKNISRSKWRIFLDQFLPVQKKYCVPLVVCNHIANCLRHFPFGNFVLHNVHLREFQLQSLIIDCAEWLVTCNVKMLPGFTRTHPVKGNTSLPLMKSFVSSKDLTKYYIDVIGFPISNQNKSTCAENPFSLRAAIST